MNKVVCVLAPECYQAALTLTRGKVTVRLASHWPCITLHPAMDGIDAQGRHGRKTNSALWCPQRDGKWAVAHRLWLIMAMMCLLAAPWVQLSVSSVIDGHVRCGTNGSCQSAATSETVKRCLQVCLMKVALLTSVQTFSLHVCKWSDFDALFLSLDINYATIPSRSLTLGSFRQSPNRYLAL